MHWTHTRNYDVAIPLVGIADSPNVHFQLNLVCVVLSAQLFREIVIERACHGMRDRSWGMPQSYYCSSLDEYFRAFIVRTIIPHHRFLTHLYTSELKDNHGDGLLLPEYRFASSSGREDTYNVEQSNHMKAHRVYRRTHRKK